MRKRSIALVLVLSMIATLMIGVLPASASATYTMSNVKTLAPSIKGDVAGTTVGTITITLDSGSMTADALDKYVYLELPNDYEWLAQTTEAAVSGTDYAFALAADVSGTVSVANPSILQVTIDAVPTNLVKPGVITITGITIFVPSGADDGPVAVTASSPSSSIFSSGSFDIAKIGSSNVLVSSADNPTMGGAGGYVTLTVKEASAGAMEDKEDTLKWKLPTGFTWDLSDGDNDITPFWGVDTNYDTWAEIMPGGAGNLLTTIDDGRTLCLDNSAVAFSGSYFKLYLKVDVDDTKAKTGDVKVSVSGKSDTDQSSFVVATYGDYGATLTAGDPPSIYAGKYDQTVGEIIIKENLDGSLIENRTITLQLPSGAKWVAVPELDSSESTSAGLSAVEFVATSSDCRTVKYTITGTSTDTAELIFNDGSVITSADFSGDLKVKASGSMGFKDELVIAQVVPAVKAAVSATKDLKIGVANQAIGDVAITEAADELFETESGYYDDSDDDNLIDEQSADEFTGYIELVAPSGVTFTGMPDVSVTEGDVDISDTSGATLAADNTVVQVEVSGTSATASTVTFKNIKLNVDRTVVEGDLKLSVRGAAIIDDNKDGDSLLFTPRRDAAQVVVGKVVTPAPDEMKNVASFTIGSTSYKVNGVDQTMDVAPYISGDRTFMPVRYVALAIGVAEQNIIWDDTAKTATLMKGDKVVQVKIGSTTMLVNGVAVNMDVAPEITDSRTMLPLRFLANAFGCTTTWDAATNTATIQ